MSLTFKHDDENILDTPNLDEVTNNISKTDDDNNTDIISNQENNINEIPVIENESVDLTEEETIKDNDSIEEQQETNKELETVVEEQQETVVEVKEKTVEQHELEMLEKISPVKITDDELSKSVSLQNELSIHLKNNFSIEEREFVKKTIPTGIDVLDAVLGGGLGMGFIQLVGPPGSGKSALAAKIIATGQRKYPGNFLAVYADSEVSMSTDRLCELGVKLPKINPYTEITVETVFKIVEGICTFKENNPKYLEYPSVIVWDSLANTPTEKAMDSEDVNSVLGEKARILAHILPKYVPRLEKYNISLVTINQLRDKIDIGIFKKPNDLRYLGDKNLPGGESSKFNSFQLFIIRPISDLKGEYGFSGVKVRGKAVKNKLFTPNIDVELIFSFKNGFSNFFSNYEFLKSTKRVKAGAWCSLVAYPDVKFRQSDLIKTYKNNPEFREVFDYEVKDAINKEIIEQYSTNVGNNELDV